MMTKRKEQILFQYKKGGRRTGNTAVVVFSSPFWPSGCVWLSYPSRCEITTN